MEQKKESFIERNQLRLLIIGGVIIMGLWVFCYISGFFDVHSEFLTEESSIKGFHDLP